MKYNKLPVTVNLYKTKADKFNSEDTPLKVKLLGLMWNRDTDTLSAPQINLDKNANTKRLVLRSVAGQYDSHGYQAPLLNRAKLFLHNLQCDSKLGWDTVLSSENLKEWKNIVKQVNNLDSIEINRSMGNRTDNYQLCAFTDASKTCYGVVVYAKNLNSNQISFLTAKNRIVNKQLELKSIPSLELHAIALGVETLKELKNGIIGRFLHLSY